MKKSSNGASKALRHIVFERDSYTCVLCENGASDVHHLIPRSQGGRNTPHNLVSLCRQCHMAFHGELNETLERRQDMYQEMCDYLCSANEADYVKGMSAWLKSKPPSCNSENCMFDD